MSKCRYTYRAAFHWNTDLSDERKDEIIAWIETLSPEEQLMVEDLVTDAYDRGFDDGDNCDGL